MRVTKKLLESRVELINHAFGFDDPNWNTIGSVRLGHEGDPGRYYLQLVLSDGGAINELSHRLTASEMDEWLIGFATGLTMAKTVV